MVLQQYNRKLSLSSELSLEAKNNELRGVHRGILITHLTCLQIILGVPAVSISQFHRQVICVQFLEDQVISV